MSFNVLIDEFIDEDDNNIIWSESDNDEKPKDNIEDDDINEDDEIITNDDIIEEPSETRVIKQKINFKIIKNKTVKIMIELNIDNKNIDISFPIDRKFFLKIAKQLK